MNPRLTLVTQAQYPDLAPDDRPLAQALRTRGIDVRVAVWNDPAVDWSWSPLTVVRSTWDYFHAPQAFDVWLTAASACTVFANGVHRLRWNAKKTYLRDLKRAGVPIVPTVFVEQRHADAAVALLDTLDWPHVVIKPCAGGSAYGARPFVLSNEFDAAMDHLSDLLLTGDALVQPYIATVNTLAERALVFIDGHYSHGVRKRPFNPGAVGDPQPLISHFASDTEVAFGLDVLRAVGPTDYARVDLVPHADGGLLLMELEMLEPSLYFAQAPSSVDVFAKHLANRLHSLTEARA